MVSWQKINKASLPLLERHYLQFEPYCHLNVADMWGWRAGPNHWFQIGDTVVYRLNDYNDDSLYFTLLGKHSVKPAIKELCAKNPRRKTVVLKCVPQETLAAIKNWGAVVSIREDDQNHDYIFNVESLVNFSSPELAHKYRNYVKLIKKHPGLRVSILNHNQASGRRVIYQIFKKWVAQTGQDDWQKELLALKRIMNLKRQKMVCLGFFDGHKAVGYTVNEPEGNDYYQAFSGKADRDYRDLGLFMEHQTAKYIQKHYGSRYMNLQPDQGLVGLRQYKVSLGPSRYLKKYIVKIDAAKALA